MPTLKRWQELQSVPEYYTFELMKILGLDIDYSLYPSSLKDQFFTPVDIARHCWETFLSIVANDIDVNEYTFIEPSAGSGVFLKFLPEYTIAFDIEPRGEKIMKQDYLLWKPTITTDKYIVFGNPPFGLRGHLALKFIIHSLSIGAEYVCFILPQLFASDGKGSPSNRIEGYRVIHSEPLTSNFITPENTNVKVNGVFQIFKRCSETDETTKVSNVMIKVYSLSDGNTPSTTRNKNMLDKCHVYLPSTCFGKHNMKIYKSFEELPGRKGYGIVFDEEQREALMSKTKSIDWSSIAFLSTNSAYNLRTSLIVSSFQ